MLVPIIQALDTLQKQFDFSFTIIGKLSHEDLPALVERDYVHFVGVKNEQEIASILRECDAYLHSQLNDNCPNAVLEAVATGLPVVAFDSGALTELCHWSTDLIAATPSKTFHLEEDFDYGSYAHKIEQLMENFTSHKDRALGHASDYGFDHCGRRYISVFEEELSRMGEVSVPWSDRVRGYRNVIKRNLKSLMGR